MRVRASTVTRTDCPFAARRPFFSGFHSGCGETDAAGSSGIEFAGVVEEIGPSVTQFEVGDRVFGLRSGAHADTSASASRGSSRACPTGMTFEQAAGTCDGMYQARNALRAGGVDDEHATGDLRRFRLARDRGSAACRGPRRARDGRLQRPNVELVRSLGADEVIDYEREDFTRNGETYDVVLDAVGKHSFLAAGARWPRRPLRGHRPALQLPARIPHEVSAGRGVFYHGERPQEDVLLLMELIEAGSTARSSTAPTRSRTSSRRRGTSRAGRRPGTSC